ncbi:MAG: M42 family metallopeptidase [Flavobacteriales bacterium]|jgi:putative aminopeptidase FrvX|tara:strand:- start:18258 stop:19304 length:1047 start_codon:yes stop_codon:yes gene_type:complete
MINTKLLAELCEVAGAPGHENRVREIVLREVKEIVDEINIDNMGNVIALKKGVKDKKVMIAAHMDEIGFIVTHIDDKGFVYFHTLGGFDPKTLTAQRVIIHGKEDVIGVMGSKPIHLMNAADRLKVPTVKDFFIDTGLSKNQLAKLIEVGSTITRERKLIEMGDCINCKSLDNRVSVFILIEMLKEMTEKPPYDTYAVFTVQEEIGIRGANVSSMLINPDYGFGLDTTIAWDTPGSTKQEQVSALGEGACIKVMDSSTVCDYRMVSYMKEISKKHKIKTQLEILPAGGTDTAGVQRMNPGGAISGAVSIPTRHIHQVIEMVHKEDVRGSIDLLKACVENLDSYNWKFV